MADYIFGVRNNIQHHRPRADRAVMPARFSRSDVVAKGGRVLSSAPSARPRSVADAQALGAVLLNTRWLGARCHWKTIFRLDQALRHLDEMLASGESASTRRRSA